MANRNMVEMSGSNLDYLIKEIIDPYPNQFVKEHNDSDWSTNIDRWTNDETNSKLFGSIWSIINNIDEKKKRNSLDIGPKKKLFMIFYII